MLYCFNCIVVVDGESFAFVTCFVSHGFDGNVWVEWFLSIDGGSSKGRSIVEMLCSGHRGIPLLFHH